MTVKEYTTKSAKVELSKKEIALICYALKVADFHNKKENQESDKLAKDFEELFNNCEDLEKITNCVKSAFSNWSI